MFDTPSRRALLGGGLVALAGCRGTEPAQVKIANAAGGLNLTMAALMRQQRFLESFGLAAEVLGVADGSRILGAMVSGSVHASMMSGFGQAFPAIERGAPIKILGGGAVLPGLGLFSAKPDVRTLKDLEGRTIGTGSIGALVYQLTATLLRKHGVDMARVRFVNIGSSADILRSVIAGTVDAGAGDAALITQAAAHGVRLVDNGNMSVELKEYTYQGAWTSDRAIAERRDSLVKTLAAYGRLYRFVQQPEARSAFLQARREVFPSAAAADHEAQWTYVQTYKPFAEALVLSPERLRYMQALNVGFGSQEQVLPFEAVADMSLAQDALKLLQAG